MIVTVNYNHPNDVKELYNSLQQYDNDWYHFLVVDNNSKNWREELIDFCNDKKVDLLLLDKNWWFASGNNAWIEYITQKWIWFEYIFLLNPDMVLKQKSFFKNFYESWSKNSIDIFGPMILYYNDPNVIHFAWWNLIWPMHFPSKIWRGKINKWQYQDLITCDYINWSALCVKKEVWESLWWLDESYFLYFEETDLCLRAKRAGYKICCISWVKVYDKISTSVWRMSNLYLYYITKNYKKFAKKNISWLSYIYRLLFYILIWVPLFIFSSLRYRNIKGLRFIRKWFAWKKY